MKTHSLSSDYIFLNKDYSKLHEENNCTMCKVIPVKFEKNVTIVAFCAYERGQWQMIY